LLKEFGGHDQSYWENAVFHGHVRINNQVVPPEYVFRNSDKMTHRTHRHEPPVAGDITFVGESDDLIAVHKPATIPMHPCGGYRYNSLTQILKNDPIMPNQPSLFLVHRLDRSEVVKYKR